MTILLEKLRPPALPDTVVARERLNDCFALSERIRLLMVQAPPGYGKSTLLAERLTQLEQPSAWLCLDARDDEPGRFAAYFREALTRLCRELGHTLELPVAGSLAEAMETWLALLPEQSAPGRLVLDDVQHIRHSQILECLRHWLCHQPSWLTLTLASRTRPDLGLPELRLRGELEEIGLSELAFDAEEAQTLCAEQLSLPPTRVSLERALRRTEGWPLALAWLIERTTTLASFDTLLERLDGSHPDFVAWFDELLARCIDEQDHQLLLQLGVLERFSPNLVARLLEGERLSQRLEALERAGLFLERIEPHSQWFRFHRLFAGYLRHRRHELSLTTQHELHQRASTAWLRLGNPALALAQAIEAEAPEPLAELLEREGPGLLANGHFSLLARGLATLGDTRLVDSPRLTLLHGWASHAQYHFDRTRQAIGWIEAQLELPEWAELAAEFATLRAQLAINEGDAERAAPLAEQALTLPPRYLATTPLTAAAILAEARFVQGYLDESLQRIHSVEREANRVGDAQMLLWALCHQSETLVAQGRLQAAFDVQERAIAHVEHAGLDRLPVCEFLYRIRSQLLWEWQRLEAAEQAALKGIEVLDTQGERWTLQCHIGLAKVALSRGDQAQCADHIRRMRKILVQGNYHIDWQANAHATLLAWWQANGDLDAVARWLQEAPPGDPAQASNHFAQCNLRNHARAMILLGRFDEAEALLVALERETERLGLTTDANRNRICLAGLEWQRGRHAEALAHLRQALTLATRTALAGSFLRLGRALSEMLERLLAEHELEPLVRGHAERLLDLARRQREFGRAVRLMLDDSVIDDIVSRPDVPELIRTSPLTRREWQILGLIHAGLSNEQIAEQLSVAPTTVKTHIRSLYQKQNIRRRDEAIALAGELLSRIQGE
ncbi:HTH-type transcriptional regulator MalT [Halomonas desiderata]|uniref:HTH-type transcriptional regulator MalT n=1 Tax=Billgrantia desiderata TaxID=52021 RepID=UPI00174D70DD|nr:HTH-type transcriptional regulator MalT [Halomonas desiderata]